jgi:hypothetical protein
VIKYLRKQLGKIDFGFSSWLLAPLLWSVVRENMMEVVAKLLTSQWAGSRDRKGSGTGCAW